MSSSSKRSSNPFVPSPRWLSESPARPPSSSQSQALRSPIPPPPANLFLGSPDAFNVDPGVPFLATAGSSDIPDSASETDSSRRPHRFVGGFVTGIRKSLRRSSKRNDIDHEFRDSGYGGSSSATAPAPPSATRRPSTTEAHVSHEQEEVPQSIYYTPPHYSNIYTDDDYRKHFDAVAELQGRISLYSGTLTAETASIKYGSDYRKMPVPLDSEDSLSAYIKRTILFFRRISDLPFSKRTRVTYDHFPERDLRDDPRRRPFVEWNRPGYGPSDFSPPPEEIKPVVSSSTIPSQHVPVMYTPHRVPAAQLDLREEFSNAPSLPKANPTPTPPPLLPIPIVSDPPPTFQPISIKSPKRQSHPLIDPSWEEAINSTSVSGGIRRTTTLIYNSPPIHAETTQPEWQQYPHYRDGYVPAELAESHYGTRYGPGIHSARPIPASGPSSVTSRKRHT